VRTCEKDPRRCAFVALTDLATVAGISQSDVASLESGARNGDPALFFGLARRGAKWPEPILKPPKRQLLGSQVCVSLSQFTQEDC
jgi:transcriptional regulator with XRE-family HTH domain